MHLQYYNILFILVCRHCHCSGQQISSLLPSNNNKNMQLISTKLLNFERRGRIATAPYILYVVLCLLGLKTTPFQDRNWHVKNIPLWAAYIPSTQTIASFSPPRPSPGGGGRGRLKVGPVWAWLLLYWCCFPDFGIILMMIVLVWLHLPPP